MIFWIEGKSDSLKRLLASVDGLVINDSEARLLAGELNSVAAARRLLDLGLKFLVIKRGEFGAALFHGGHYFAVPAYPVERPVDPTGAGDSFAGGFMGHLARAASTSGAALRQAMIYGTVMASFCVEDFSLKRLAAVNDRGIEARAREMRAFLDIEGPKRKS
jgi:sugar/nucleoside kinase (ribokinase family)